MSPAATKASLNGTVATKPTVRIQTVTPGMAKNWLEGNVDNRKLRETRAVYLGGVIARGEWELTGDAIVFDTEGVLINGQHRLTAIVIANLPVEILVLKGVPSKAQEVMDQGLPRSLGDQLHRRGVPYWGWLSSALTWVAQLEYNEATGNVHYPTSDYRPSTRQLLHMFEENTDLVDDCRAVAGLLKKVKVRPGPAVALYHRFKQIDAEECDLFFDQWEKGVGLAEDSSVWKLREWCLEDARTRGISGRAPTYRMVALTIKAWNLYRDATPVRALTWKYGPITKEPWPVPH